MGGSQRSTEEKLHTVPVGERVWLSFHWTGPIESTAGTSYGAKQGGGELRLIETRPGGEVIDNALADYPHPTPAECVNSLADGPRSQPRFRPNRQDQRPTDTPLTHRGFPTAVSSPLHAPVQIHTPCGR